MVTLRTKFKTESLKRVDIGWTLDIKVKVVVIHLLYLGEVFGLCIIFKGAFNLVPKQLVRITEKPNVFN